MRNLLASGTRSFSPSIFLASNARAISSLANISFSEQELIPQILRNARFDVTTICPTEEKGLVDRVVNSLFKRRITENKNQSALGGEKVLTVAHANSSDDTSVHLMHFGGANGEIATQDKHSHGGPRFLTILAGNPWCLYLGQQMDNIPEEFPLKMVKIAFPGNSMTTLHLKERTLHGFEGGSVGAVSFHWTDKKEIESSGINPDKLTDKDVMEKLTRIPPQSIIKIIDAMSYEKAQALQNGIIR